MGFQDYFFKLILASSIGFLVWIERSSRRNSQIGVGTTSTFLLACTLLTIISKECLGGADISRLIANIITAVGFLCGSVIFLKEKSVKTDNDTNDKEVNDTNDKEVNDTEVVGLTTGAVLFALTGVGIAIGLGYVGLAITATLMIDLNVFFARRVKKLKGD